MTFKELFNKYKVLIFILYSFALFIAMICINAPKIWWVKLILSLPAFALGIYILVKSIPKKTAETMTVVCADGLGTVQITMQAITKAIRNSTNAIEGVRYNTCVVSNDKTGLVVKLNIRIAFSHVMEISEVTRIFIKKVLEKEMNIRVSKIDIVVSNYIHTYKVDRIEPETEKEEIIAPVQPLSEKGNHDPEAVTYKLRHGEKETTLYMPKHEAQTAEPVKVAEPVISQPAPAVSYPASVSAPAAAPAAQTLREQKTASAPKSAPAAKPAALDSKPSVPDPHTNVEEVALPVTAKPHTDESPKSRADLLQQQRAETQRKYEELRARQAGRKNK